MKDSIDKSLDQSLENVKIMVEELVIKEFKGRTTLSFAQVLKMCSDKVHEELKFVRKTKSQLFDQINVKSIWKENLQEKTRKSL